jgi:hypothetical protein
MNPGACLPTGVSLRRWLALGAIWLALASDPALALRPFDSTDADVARPGEFELEFGPLGYLHEGNNKWYVAPAIVGNIGLQNQRELVLQGQRERLRDGTPGAPSTSFVNTGLFIKQVLRQGVLQDETGPSIATEYGVLLPEVHGDSKTGLSWAGIVSQRWPAGTVHLNAAVELNREHNPDAFLGVILEGPYEWTVRPVIEVFTEQASNNPRTVSQLAGMVWRRNENLSFDLGIRSASTGDQHIHEIRIGLTWSFDWRK